MSSLKKLQKSLSALNPLFRAREDRGCIVLTGESDEWGAIVKAGKHIDRALVSPFQESGKRCVSALQVIQMRR